MKRNMKDCFSVGIIAFFIAISVFLLLNNAILVFNTFSFIIIISIIFISIYILMNLLRMQKNEYLEYMKNNYCCCCNLIAIGAAGTFISAILILFVNDEVTILLNILLSILFFFLVLSVGGIVCLLYAINNCHPCYHDPCDEHHHEKEDCRKNEYYKHEYNERRR